MREDAHRLVVRGLAATGRRAEALKHYQDFASLLKRELNAEPDGATRALIVDLRRAQPADAFVATTRDAAPRDGGPPFAATGRLGGSERRQLTIIACHMV